MIVKITLNDTNNPPGKLADAELHFTEGLLEGLKLIGFGVWESRAGSGQSGTPPPGIGSARRFSRHTRRMTKRRLSPRRPLERRTTRGGRRSAWRY